MPMNQCAVILAAGEGKRMKSNRPKVLSPVLFKPMLSWVLDAVKGAGVKNTCVVTGFMREAVEDFLEHGGYSEIEHVVQAERRGTGHAVMTARPFLERHRGGNVLVLNGDAPFIGADLIKGALDCHLSGGNAVTVISAKVDDPTGYGRIVRDKATGMLSAIVEQKDADEATREIREVNSGTFWFQVDSLLSVLDKIQNHNAQGEYYLPDAVRLLIASGKRADAFSSSDGSSVLGANDCAQLQLLNEIARNRVLTRLMLAGVEIPCRDGVLIGPDVTIGQDTCVYPGTILKGNVKIGRGCTLGPNTYVSNSEIGDGCTLCQVHCEGCTLPDHTNPAPFTNVTYAGQA